MDTILPWSTRKADVFREVQLSREDSSMAAPAKSSAEHARVWVAEGFNSNNQFIEQDKIEARISNLGYYTRSIVEQDFVNSCKSLLKSISPATLMGQYTVPS